MVSMLIYDKIEEELSQIHEAAKNLAAYLSEEYWNIMLAPNRLEMETQEKEIPLLDVACMDITGEGDIDCVEELRKRYREMFLLLVADTSISPMSYVRPGIMASSLLLRPCEEKDIRRIMKEFLKAYVESFEMRHGEKSFVIESKEGKTLIPYNKIYYFEAREKRLFIQTDRVEYGFYGTIDKVERELPPYFMRCHRSFIVNTRKIEKVALSRNIIYLSEDRDVPLSRSYKSVVKELGKV